MTLLSVRKWQAEDDRFQGSDCRTSAAAALTYTSAMIARSPSNSTCRAQTHSSESYLGIVCSLDEPLFEKLLFHHCSGPPGSSIFIHLLICEHCLVNRIPVHHSLENTNMKTCSALNQILSFYWDFLLLFQFMFNSLFFFPKAGKVSNFSPLSF